MTLKEAPAKVPAASSCQETPPLLDLRRPAPETASPEKTSSPVPAYTMLVALGAKATAPKAREAWSSEIGLKFVPASTVSQRPPWAAPMIQCLKFAGLTAMSPMRPETGCEPAVWPLTMGAGPIGTQTFPGTIAFG